MEGSHRRTIHTSPLRGLLSGLLLCGLLAAPTLAHADSEFREGGRGWFLAGDVAVGAVTYNVDAESISETGAFVHLRFGGMLIPRLALSAEFWSDGHGYEGSESAASTQNTWAFALTYWALPKLWVTTALGSSTVKGFNNGTEIWRERGIAFMGGAGYEILSRPRYSVDITTRVIGSWFDPFSRRTISIGAGVAWH